MSIRFSESRKLFILSGKTISYVFYIDANGRPVHLHFGGKVLGEEGLVPQEIRKGHSSFSPWGPGENPKDSPDALPLEFSGFNTGDFRIGSATVLTENGSQITDALYVSHRIYPGKGASAGLPCAYAGETGNVETLEVTLRDTACEVEFVLRYSVFEDCDTIVRSVRAVNRSASPVVLRRLMSAQLDLPHTAFDFIQLSGSWARERHAERTPLHPGIQAIRSVRGASGHQNSPAIALAAHDATEYSGDVCGALLAYSGNFLIETECEQYGTARLVLGINPEMFSWTLAPGEAFETPEACLTFSGEGLGRMSRNFHDFMRNHLIRDGWARKKRPLLVNSWEAAYFDFDSEKLLGIAKSAAELGIEMLVLDDGWFGERNDDTTSLGDWFVNTAKIGDLGGLVRKINALGLKFGLWFEPEMISEKSLLYREHPDWVLHEPGRRRSIGRQQMVLDMSRPEVVQYLFDTIAGVLRSANIEYIKWDMNRNLTEVYSAALPPERQGEVAHRYVLGVYRLHEMLLEAFPGLLIEGCSGGGGRFDAGMLGYVPQIWCSDDTDAMERIRIQLGTSLFYPVSAMGAHVSVCPNHITGRSTPFATRGNIALSGTFGYELDLTKLSEEEREMVRVQVAEYHKYHDLIACGDLYRLSNAFSVNAFDAWMYVSPDRREALITAVCRFDEPNSCVRFVCPRGLDPERIYEMDGMRVSGATLMALGIQVKSLAGDGASRLYYLRALS